MFDTGPSGKFLFSALPNKPQKNARSYSLGRREIVFYFERILVLI